VHRDGLADDEAILDELADGLTGVGVGDFAGLVGVEPDLALSATDHGGREALLSAEVDPVRLAVSISVNVRLWATEGRCYRDEPLHGSGASWAQQRAGEGVAIAELLVGKGLGVVQAVSLHFRWAVVLLLVSRRGRGKRFWRFCKRCSLVGARALASLPETGLAASWLHDLQHRDTAGEIIKTAIHYFACLRMCSE
jgi:hypothetical protein